MNWVDDKFDEQERRKTKARERSADAVQQHRRDLATAATNWSRLIKALKADIAIFNKRSHDSRVGVSANPEYIEVYWLQRIETALMIARKLDETTATIGARKAPKDRWRKPNRGSIDLLASIDGLSEKLLAPLLFDWDA